MWPIHAMEYYSAVKKTEAQMHTARGAYAAVRMNPINITAREKVVAKDTASRESIYMEYLEWGNVEREKPVRDCRGWVWGRRGWIAHGQLNSCRRP